MAETVYQCGHTIIKAHGLAYRIYETEFKDQQQGQVGITLNTDWNEPDVDDAEHRDASDRGLRFSVSTDIRNIRSQRSHLGMSPMRL